MPSDSFGNIMYVSITLLNLLEFTLLKSNTLYYLLFLLISAFFTVLGVHILQSSVLLLNHSETIPLFGIKWSDF